MLRSIILAVLASTLAQAHIIISYPGWRGNNLITNETFPYGMQWMYPCGGYPTTTNRTFWPTTGGAVAFQPGWFQGHQTAFLYVNLGFGTDGPGGGPRNMSFPMVPPFQLLGPSKNPYPGTVCLPQVPLPVNTTVRAGDNATIQIVEIAAHGAALFSCVDITFAEPNDPRIEKVNKTNCFNSTDFGFAELYTITTHEPGASANKTSGALSRLLQPTASAWSWFGYLPVVLGSVWMIL
ncbi:uncharacterized protein B0I36DRAFT_245481 [Microdochium trichocladiopsis]|uniref:Copper acquisition factor BIM1-like domain-containing protein n=1 Tax=Microdochium trichocladiopsis TaxID=1682393 RepID=A0A9P8Y565_9PEZI|nr:uncharacterized protein B0I36DRAFT_245481 [Microdochium trichocladiopsis]KAH7029569.1 hypothetical protein B0I36DRAFT_245481 [Microdochium trichocladiopsis]